MLPFSNFKFNYHCSLVILVLLSSATFAPLFGADAANDAMAMANNEVLPQAAYAGNLERVNYLLQHGTPVNQAGALHQTALMQAAKRGRAHIVQRLLEVPNIEVNLVDFLGNTALMLAIDGGHVEVVRQLLEDTADTDVNIAGAVGFTPLMLAAADGNNAIVQLLLESPDTEVNKRGTGELTALMYAAEEGHADVVAQLIDAGAELDATNDMGKTALMIAAARGHNDIVEMLVEAGAAA